MNRFMIAMAALCLTAPAHSQAPAKVRFEVQTSDINLDTQAGIDRLTQRIVVRLRIHCGRLADYTGQIGISGNARERFEQCLTQFRITSTHPAAETAMSDAIKRVRG